MGFFTNGTDNFGKVFLKRGRIAMTVVIVVAALVLLAACFDIVPPGHTGVVTILGAVSDNVLSEGLHFKAPIITTIIKVDNRVMKVEVDSSSASKDLQTVRATISLNYKVDRSSSSNIYKYVGMDYENVIIRPAIQECIKAVTAKYTAEELITKRQDVGEQMKSLISEKIDTYGLRAEIFNIVNFDFSEEFNKAIEAKQTAQQAALKAEQDLARIKIEAEQKIADAQAEAEAYRLKSQEITDDMIRMEAIKKWDGKLPNYYAGDKGSIFNIPIQ